MAQQNARCYFRLHNHVLTASHRSPPPCRYEDLPTDGRPFERKTVAVLGLGNSAFETADALAPFVNYVHTFPGHANNGPGQTLPVALAVGETAILMAPPVPLLGISIGINRVVSSK